MKKPIVFIIFNRPDTTSIVFKEIRKYRPEKLFVIADGPRIHKEYEEDLCEETRNTVKVDWECEVIKIYSNTNLGCQQRVYTGLNEVFNHVEEAIILEDDCVPHQDFFRYCEELLDYYKEEPQVMAISGNNFQDASFEIEDSYYYSIFPHCWGWATWKNAWLKMDVTMRGWEEFKFSQQFSGISYDALFQDYWIKVFDKVEEGKLDSWAYPWTFSCWKHNGLTVLPKKNLISNIGFDERATHTINSNSRDVNLSIYPMEFPLKHPSEININYRADHYTSENHYGLANIKKNMLINEEKLNFLQKGLLSIPRDFKDKEVFLFGAGDWAKSIEKVLLSHGKAVESFIVTTKDTNCTNIKEISEVKFSRLSIVIVCVEGHHDKIIVERLKLSFLKQPVEIFSWRDLILKGSEE